MNFYNIDIFENQHKHKCSRLYPYAFYEYPPLISKMFPSRFKIYCYGIKKGENKVKDYVCYSHFNFVDNEKYEPSHLKIVVIVHQDLLMGFLRQSLSFKI